MFKIFSGIRCLIGTTIGGIWQLTLMSLFLGTTIAISSTALILTKPDSNTFHDFFNEFMKIHDEKYLVKEEGNVWCHLKVSEKAHVCFELIKGTKMICVVQEPLNLKPDADLKLILSLKRRKKRKVSFLVTILAKALNEKSIYVISTIPL